MVEYQQIWIGLGANLGFQGRPPQANLARAVTAIAQIWRVAAISSLWSSPAWPDPADPPFVNAAIGALAPAALAPPEMMAHLLQLEGDFGRRRGRPNAPRTLDLDLLAITERTGLWPGPPRVDLPHPRLLSRAFALGPLAEIAPSLLLGADGQSAAALYAELAPANPRCRRVLTAAEFV
ncbi:MAG TPA: 2-amino-4-hydroxy-6-hydroxymethyldihydropteridine diphosphokinase [Hyphomonadaceae bacterium]|nr:2-amino-4-hydroxy-6-hydroxymethyldihydropteridine diphosphokinase [Hyphomonadaceae bacterium]